MAIPQLLVLLVGSRIVCVYALCEALKRSTPVGTHRELIESVHTAGAHSTPPRHKVATSALRALISRPNESRVNYRSRRRLPTFSCRFGHREWWPPPAVPESTDPPVQIHGSIDLGAQVPGRRSELAPSPSA